ncbi:hypothetical protein F4775DRAFT_593459 [Biscogniauxia sp. FL1348]|nr:hypothetical protein F4775DRAFT_593459 [Biscogniauxia sp. FL1348]
MATATCKACRDPLVLEVEDEEGANDGSQSVPDDLELSCGCHFHWQCLLDQSLEVSLSLKCPSCDAQLATNAAGPSASNQFFHVSSAVTIPTRYTNEGGIQENLDILPALTEEAYLEANPEARRARAFHVMCSEGDVGPIIDLLRKAEQPDDDDGGGGFPTMSPAKLLRYQDPLANMRSALHVAIDAAQEEIVWLLLWLASPLRTAAFPESARHAAGAIGLQRPAVVAPQEDIRALTDSRGRTAEAFAAEKGGPWEALVQAGVLRPGLS